MPRHLVERTFKGGLSILVNDEGATICQTVVANNAEELVTWAHSYVNEDKTKTFCVYDGPSPKAIRRAATHNSLPVDHITEVTVLDPYFYK
ncbi:MAG TPA: DUF4242 domain-containing protein [Ktedonobacterales bacterium]